MKVNINRVRQDTEIPIPTYATKGSVAFDFHAALRTVIGPKQLGLIPTNYVIEVPHGFMLVIALRSSSPKRKGLLMPHGIGIVDQDYCGPNDEVLVQVYNFSDEVCVIEKGERIAQGLFIPTVQIEWAVKEYTINANRGGYGSTGV